ncbi:pilus assembly protein PilM [Candidatus Sumerlaeota bacterium]|nr:pilus assembly protein PilM [Candidatus Sumerlaeota bacterium]
MAAMRYRRCLGVDYGADSVKIVELALNRNKDQQSLVIQNVCQAEIEAPHDAPDEVRRDAVIRTIRNLIKKHRIQTKQAVFSMPGQSVFTRKIRLPATAPDRLERIIKFEARQQIPFPPDQTDLQWQVFDRSSTGEYVDVLLVAIRKDLIEDFMDVVSRCGLQTVQISVSSFDLYNGKVFLDRGMPKGVIGKKGKRGARGKKGGLLGLKKGGDGKDEKETLEEELESLEEEMGGMDEYEEVKAYIHMGASTFDLAIRRQSSNSDQLGFVRSVPIAGNEMTKAVRDALGLGDFNEAEEIKKRRAKIVTPGFDDTDDEGGRYNLDACRALVKPVNRIVSELRRSLDFYISQPDGVSVDLLELSGGQAMQPNIVSYFEDKLGLPVADSAEFAEKEFIEFAGPQPEDFNPFSIALGQALSGMGLGQIDINFLPKSLKSAENRKKKYVLMMLMGIILFVMIVGSFNVGVEATRNYHSAASSFRKTIDRIQAFTNALSEAEKARKKVADQYANLAKALPPNNNFWFDLYRHILDARPAGQIALVRLEIDSLGKINILGIAPRLPTLTNFVNQLTMGPVADEYFAVNASGEKIITIEDDRMQHDPDMGREVIYFAISAQLNDSYSRWRDLPEETAAAVGNPAESEARPRGGGPANDTRTRPGAGEGGRPVPPWMRNRR